MYRLLSLPLAAALLLAACGSDGSSASGNGDAAAGGTDGSTAAGTDSTGTSGTDTASTDAGGTDTAGTDTGGTAPPPPVAVWTEDCPADAPEFRRLDVGEVELNVACQGSGETLVLLHGFPEFWYGWKELMPLLAQSYRVIVPDQRGYNLSDKPEGQDNYTGPHLLADGVGLIQAVSNEAIVVVGHDWGGAVAWALGSERPDLVKRLVILNAPHPDVFARELANNPAQKTAFSYADFFTTANAEAALAADDYALLADATFNASFSDEDRLAYREAWSQPGALTAMLNWYRANYSAGELSFSEAYVEVPTLVLWGLADTALLPGNLDGLDKYVTTLDIKTYAEGTHWVAHEKPAEIAKDIDDWLNGRPVEPEPAPLIELPQGLVGDIVSDPVGLPTFSGVLDENNQPVMADQLLGSWNVIWFYPKASTFG